MYKTIEQFRSVIEPDPIFSIRGAISPLFLIITWDDKTHPLYILSVTKGRDAYLALNEKKYITIAIEKFRRYFNEELSVQDLESEYFDWEHSVQSYLDELVTKNLSSLTNVQLQDCMKKLNDLFIELANKTLYIENVDYDKILEVVGQASKKILDDIWDRATEASFLSFDMRRLKKTIDILDSDPQNAVRKSKFIYTDYFWTKTETEISQSLQEISDNREVKIQEFEKKNDEAIKRYAHYETWLQTLDPISKRIAVFAQLVMKMRDTRKDPIAQIHAMLAEVSVVMLERAQVNPQFAPYVLIYEYMKGVDHLFSIKENIESRTKGCIYLTEPDFSYSIELCDFESAIDQISSLSQHKDEHITTLTGQTACRGNVTGVVRVVLDPHDDKGFQDGDILVTSMTRPEFVPIMKRAGAVVTNEGGITCHAAIVSRELNIPCVIGTKIATQILNDGDAVEVDANNGIVKIIK